MDGQGPGRRPLRGPPPRVLVIPAGEKDERVCGRACVRDTGWHRRVAPPEISPPPILAPVVLRSVKAFPSSSIAVVLEMKGVSAAFEKRTASRNPGRAGSDRLPVKRTALALANLF